MDYCGNLNIKFLNKIVNIYGWVLNLRCHNFYIFLDIKDITGIIQIVLLRKNKNFFKFLKVGWCLNIIGLVCLRNFSNYNYSFYNGNIEIFLIDYFYINFFLKKFFINNIYFIDKFNYKCNFSKNLFLHNNIKIKNFLFLNLNLFFIYEKFFNIETSILSRFFSEGSNVFIVPFRLKSTFFSLSQSPQIFKQILMIFGFNKYYQFSKCFRDEGYRSDRSIEFLQLDCEISFLNFIDILFFFEILFNFIIFKIFHYINFKNSTIIYKKCLKKFFQDKPDLRFKLNFYSSSFLLYIYFFKFKFYIFNLHNFFFLLGKNFKNYLFFLKILFNNLFFLFFINNFFYINIFYFEKNIRVFLFEIFSYFNINKINIILNLDKNFNFKKIFFFNFFLINNFINFKFFFIWILNFLLFKYCKNKYIFNCNLFSKLLSFDNIFLDFKPITCCTKSYDLIINGIEIGGGSIRNDKVFLQKKVFLICFNIFELSYNFKFFLNSLKYAPPIHGGVAFGLDRFIIIILGVNNFKCISIISKSNTYNCFFSKTPNFIF
ncbi:amino acid--tRNA ligase-related protein [Candidatus Nasuia deltocephalinicola]|uniref:amino acid--tRNA ligase-related protein n=1 Tax=Candidatus Nasuia deltocephalincola TaxID=1160784 RepID=UPI00216AEBB3|nr:amino acid--tRNA ligase-related protein [Candidatus Nasuia deltocephalinicola]